MLKFYFLLLLCLSLHTQYTHSYDFLRQPRQNENNDALGIRRLMGDFDKARSGKHQVTNLDSLRYLFVVARRISLWQSLNNIEDLYRVNRMRGKLQPIIPPSEPFPCDPTYGRSPQPPTSVHQLRPGDIDIIASLGDSLSAGNGIISGNVMHTLTEFRGVSFAGGGIGDWRTFLTLPNILKVYNPNLYGYSTADSLTVDSTSRLNIAEPMIMSRDLPFQARIIIDRMRNDPNIDMQNHWKLLTVFVGSNDVCSDICHHENITEFLQNHEHDLRRTFSILRHNVPRLLINLVPVANVVRTLLPLRNVPLICAAIHRIGCHCVFSHRYKEAELERTAMNIDRWMGVEEYVAQLPEFQADDFAVVYQPFTTNAATPLLPNGDADLRYFASDCFHFSQLGHAALANSLWNNMLQPVQQKQRTLDPAFIRFECPTEEHPYLATLYNS